MVTKFPWQPLLEIVILAKKYLQTKIDTSMPLNSLDINNLSCCYGYQSFPSNPERN